MSKVTSLKQWREASGHDVRIREDGSKEVSLSFVGDPGKTQQSDAQFTDIGFLIRHFAASGIDINKMPEDEFRDFTNLPASYQECMNAVNDMDELFMSLPLKVRSTFDQDPMKFMAAVEDPAQRDLLVQLGVFVPKDGAKQPSGDKEVKDSEAKPT